MPLLPLNAFAVRKANLRSVAVLGKVIRTSLGPQGRDKVIVTQHGEIVATNDGHTALKAMLDAARGGGHPATYTLQRMVVELSAAQDARAGDGTTSVVVLAGALAEECISLLEKQSKQQMFEAAPGRFVPMAQGSCAPFAMQLAQNLSEVLTFAVEELGRISVEEPMEGRRRAALEQSRVLRSIACTSLNSKSVGRHRELMASMCIEAVLTVTDFGSNSCDLAAVKCVSRIGQQLEDSVLLKGVLLERSFAHEKTPRRLEDVGVAVVSFALDAPQPTRKYNLNVGTAHAVDEVADVQRAHCDRILDVLRANGVGLILTQWGADAGLVHHLAEREIAVVTWLPADDMERISLASGCRICSDLRSISSATVGRASSVYEFVTGNDGSHLLAVEGGAGCRAASLLVRGGSELFCREALVSLHDCLRVTRAYVLEPRVLLGGGAVEGHLFVAIEALTANMELKKKQAMRAWAKALLCLPITLAENAGLDAIRAVHCLVDGHREGKRAFAINVDATARTECRDLDGSLYEPHGQKVSMLILATNFICALLRINTVLVAP